MDYSKKKVDFEDDHEPSNEVVMQIEIRVLDRITIIIELVFEGIDLKVKKEDEKIYVVYSTKLDVEKMVVRITTTN